MTRSVWPRWEGGPTITEYARRMLESGDSCPFDGTNPEDGGEIIKPDAGDWATRAARGIIRDFDDRGPAFNEAFHPEKIDDETRIEIIDVMAEIIRVALLSKG